MSKLITLRMTRAEANQLLAYLNSRDRGYDAGWYFGPREEFQRRHESLKKILERVLSNNA